MVFNRPKQLSEQERSDLYATVSRAGKTKDFLESVFWKHVLAPYLKAEEAKSGTVWKPGMEPDINKVASQVFFNSGMSTAYEKIRQDFSIWIQQGEDAAKELARDKEMFRGAVK